MAVWNYLESLMPHLVLFVFALVLPALDYLFKDKRVLALVSLVPLVSLVILLVGWLFLDVWAMSTSMIDLIEVNAFSGLFMLVFLFVGIVVVLGSPEFIRTDRNQGEYYSLILLAITGMTIVAESTDLIALFVGLEIAGISSFALSGFRKTEKRSAEDESKYFIIGGSSSALTLFAITLIYGIAGTTRIVGIEPILAGNPAGIDAEPMLILASVLLMAGFGGAYAHGPA